MTRVRVVVGTEAWLEWLPPFLDDPRYLVEISRPRLAPAEAVVFLSGHETLRRDASYAGPLREIGVAVVVCQPPAVVDLAHDKRAMARRASEVDTFRPIPELDPKQAQRALAMRKTRFVVAKRNDGTEGRGMVLFERAEDLMTTGRRLYEGGFLLQPFIGGEEFSVNMAWHEGRCNIYPTVSKGRSSETHPILRTRRCPAPLPAALLQGCVEYLRPYRPSGVVEIEFIRRSGEYFLLDVNPRVSATLRMTAVAAASNPFSDLIAAAVSRGSLGKTIPARQHTMEWPLVRELDPEERAHLERRKNTWVSTRITIAAPDIRSLDERARELRWLLE